MEGSMSKRPKMLHDVKIDKDRLTELPRPLLDHILSFLPMHEVIKTSVLAKRWRTIWLTVPFLSFPYAAKGIKKSIASINNSIFFSGSKIQKLYISMKYNDGIAGIIDSWVRFALTRDVSELCLEFNYGTYPLPASVLSSRLLTCLTLNRCCVTMPSRCKLSSLRILKLEAVELTSEVLNGLVSASPLLEDLFLTHCIRVQSFDLNIVNASVKTLKIYERNLNINLTVTAPHVTSFELGAMSWNSYAIKRMFSLENASFDCTASYHVQCAEQCKRALGEAIESTCHVKDLRLNSCFIQALSITREKMVASLSFGVTCLVLTLGLTKCEFPGIAYILQHSPNIETLVINIENISGSKENYNSEGKHDNSGYWKLQEREGFDNVLQNLKTVKVYNFTKNLDLDEKMFTYASTNKLVGKLQKDLEFLRFLLKKSSMLERMIIRIYSQNLKSCKSKTKKLDLLDLLTKVFQGYCRASRVAEVKID